MLRSSTQLAESHGDDLGLECLWNGDKYGSLENSLKSNGEKRRICRTTRNLSPSACYRDQSLFTMNYEDSDKDTVFGEFFTDRPSIDIFIIQKNVTTNEN